MTTPCTAATSICVWDGLSPMQAGCRVSGSALLPPPAGRRDRCTFSREVCGHGEMRMGTHRHCGVRPPRGERPGVTMTYLKFQRAIICPAVCTAGRPGTTPRAARLATGPLFWRSGVCWRGSHEGKEGEDKKERKEGKCKQSEGSCRRCKPLPFIDVLQRSIVMPGVTPLELDPRGK